MSAALRDTWFWCCFLFGLVLSFIWIEPLSNFFRFILAAFFGEAILEFFFFLSDKIDLLYIVNLISGYLPITDSILLNIPLYIVYIIFLGFISLIILGIIILVGIIGLLGSLIFSGLAAIAPRSAVNPLYFVLFAIPLGFLLYAIVFPVMYRVLKPIFAFTVGEVVYQKYVSLIAGESQMRLRTPILFLIGALAVILAIGRLVSPVVAKEHFSETAAQDTLDQKKKELYARRRAKVEEQWERIRKYGHLFERTKRFHVPVGDKVCGHSIPQLTASCEFIIRGGLLGMDVHAVGEYNDGQFIWWLVGDREFGEIRKYSIRYAWIPMKGVANGR